MGAIGAPTLATAFGGRRYIGNVGLLLKGNEEESSRERARALRECPPRTAERNLPHDHTATAERHDVGTESDEIWTRALSEI